MDANHDADVNDPNGDLDFNDFEPLEDLDDDEFGIPPVANPQSLEEILEDTLDQMSLEDEEIHVGMTFNETRHPMSHATVTGIALTNLSKTLSLNSKGSSSDNRSRTSSARKRRDQEKRGSVMR